MLRSKTSYHCTECSYKYIAWQGICNLCKKGGTIIEEVVPPIKPQSREAPDARRIRLRAKRSEREEARRMTIIDGPDPAYAHMVTSTGRVGHISGLRIDGISKTYVMENKNVKMPTWLIKAWILLNQRARDFNKQLVLHIDPPNMPKEIPSQGTKVKLDTMAVITQSRHEELILKEQALDRIVELSDTWPADIDYGIQHTLEAVRSYKPRKT